MILVTSTNFSVEAGDHADGNINAGKIADLYAFTKNQKLVLIMTLDDLIPIKEREDSTELYDIDSYHFKRYVKYKFMIDRNATVDYSSEEENKLYGGKVIYPEKIQEDVIIAVDFSNIESVPTVSATLRNSGPSDSISLNYYVGIRDDPFIRGGVIGCNLPVIVVEIPISHITPIGKSKAILIWASTSIYGNKIPIDHGGRVYRSQFKESLPLNFLHPSRHYKKYKVPPDVIIFDLKKPAKFPNGRSLTDNVVSILRPDLDNPKENDVLFEEKFPYLGLPQNGERCKRRNMNSE